MLSPSQTLTDAAFEDRRLFTPNVAIQISRRSPDRQAASSAHRGLIETAHAPALRQARVCASRKERREVIHALKKTGRGSKSPRRKTADSKIKC